MFEIAPEVRYPMRKASLNILLFYDQSEKSPDSGIRVDDT